MQNTQDLEMGLFDVAMIIVMDTFNDVKIVDKGLKVSLANGKTAIVSIKKVEDNHLIEQALNEKFDLKALEQKFENTQNEKIMLHNASHLMQYLNYCLPDIFFASMLARNVFILENKFYQICIN